MQEEVWKDVPNYEGLYQVSDLGKIKSLSKKVCNHRGCHITKEVIKEITINKYGYCAIGLSKENIKKTKMVHQLVAMAFLNHIPCGHKMVVDHINDNKLDNRLENLQIITQRENSYKKRGKYSSQYKGVCWYGKLNKWSSSITINNKKKHLGYFINEYDAHLAYQNAVKEIELGLHI